MRCNPETKYTEVFTQAGYDGFPGADNTGRLFPSERPSHCEGHLGGVCYFTTDLGPVSGSRKT